MQAFVFKENLICGNNDRDYFEFLLNTETERNLCLRLENCSALTIVPVQC